MFPRLLADLVIPEALLYWLVPYENLFGAKVFIPKIQGKMRLVGWLPLKSLSKQCDFFERFRTNWHIFVLELVQESLAESKTAHFSPFFTFFQLRSTGYAPSKTQKLTKNQPVFANGRDS